MEAKDKIIVEQIEEIFLNDDDTLGHKKIGGILKIGKNRARRIMKKYGLAPRKRTSKYYYRGKTNLPPAANLANQEQWRDNFDLGIIYSDIFEFKLADYSRVRGCFALLKQTKQVLSLVFDYSMKDDLVIQTISDVKISQNKDFSNTDSYYLWHSDQGRQYGSHKTREKIIEKGLIQSMSRPGTPTDNPYAERFVSTFKHAVVKRQPYYCFGEFLQNAKHWINFYNNQRPHEGADDLPPNTYAQKYDWPQVPYIANLVVH